MFVIDSFSFFSFSVMRQLPLPCDHSFECYFEKPEAKASGFSRKINLSKLQHFYDIMAHINRQRSQYMNE